MRTQDWIARTSYFWAFLFQEKSADRDALNFAAGTGLFDRFRIGTPGAIALLCTLTVLGDTCASFSGLPVPGAAIGMLLLVSLFAIRGEADAAMVRVFDAATPYFPMFFVPAAVGVISSAEVIATAWAQLAIAVVLGTAVTIAATGAIAQALLVSSVEEPNQ